MFKEFDQSRRTFISENLFRLAGAGAIMAGVRPSRMKAAEVKTIIEAQYDPARGQVGLPWGSAVEIAAGLWDSAFDKYDALDQVLNGDRARSNYWKTDTGEKITTKRWIKSVCDNALKTQDPGWTGFCQDAAASSWFVPVISGDIPLLGINFTEQERLKIATFSFAGLYRDPEYPQVSGYESDISREFYNGNCVVINRVFGEDWWGVLTDIDSLGNYTISRPTLRGEAGVQSELRNPGSLHNVAVIRGVDQVHPNRGGNFHIFDRDVGGLVIGTRTLA